jgi:hypothetical protein
VVARAADVLGAEKRFPPAHRADLEEQQSCAANEVQLRITEMSRAGWNVVASAALAVYAALAARL